MKNEGTNMVSPLDAILIERSPKFVEIAKKVSAHINSLHLGTDDHNNLVDLVIEQVREAEATAFRQGFRLGVDVERRNNEKK